VLALASVGLLAAATRPAEWRVFDRMLLLETTSETSASVSLGDVDRDGDLDIVLAKGRHWPLQDLVLHNDGKGRFATFPLAKAADRTYSAALADLNGDGILDIVASNDRPDRKLVYLGDSQGFFAPAGTFGDSTWSTRYVTLADLNGDARPDVIVANRSGNAARLQPSFVCLNDGAAQFPSCTPLATRSATIIVAADLDGDGRIDLFVPHRDGGQSLVFWNDGTGRFAAAPTPVGPAAVQVRAAAAGDIDGDGRTDLVFGDLRTNRVLLLPNAGSRSFRDAALISADSIAAGAIAVADLNKDAAADIVVGATEGPGTIFFNAGKGVPMRFDAARWNDGKGTVYGVAVGDLDGDSWPDLAVARSEAPNAVWFSRAGRRP
jgi:hypothetical protein